MSVVILPRYCERFCIGLTGGIASGKSTVSARLSELGAAVVDTDVIAHQLTQAKGAAMAAIEAAFGAAYINADGSLNRSAMRALVFAQPAERARLEAILHPMIHAQTQAQGNLAAGAYVVFVVPLLVEGTRWRAQVDRIAVVDSDPAVQLARLMQRPGLTEQQGLQIIAAQAKREHRTAAADDILHNHGDKKALLKQIDALHSTYLTFSNTHASSIR